MNKISEGDLLSVSPSEHLAGDGRKTGYNKGESMALKVCPKCKSPEILITKYSYSILRGEKGSQAKLWDSGFVPNEYYYRASCGTDENCCETEFLKKHVTEESAKEDLLDNFYVEKV